MGGVGGGGVPGMIMPQQLQQQQQQQLHSGVGTPQFSGAGGSVGGAGQYHPPSFVTPAATPVFGRPTSGVNPQQPQPSSTPYGQPVVGAGSGYANAGGAVDQMARGVQGM